MKFKFKPEPIPRMDPSSFIDPRSGTLVPSIQGQIAYVATELLRIFET